MNDSRIISLGDAQKLEYISGAFESLALESLAESIEWTQNDIQIFGKVYKEPRLTAWFGPKYQYSSIKWPARELPPSLEKIQNKLIDLTNFHFNAVLLNYYRDGQDSMGWHRDNESEIDQRCIASISLGTARNIDFRHRRKKELKQRIKLEHGSLLFMWNCQEDWEHQIPKSKKISEARINLTFRRIKA